MRKTPSPDGPVLMRKKTFLVSIQLDEDHVQVLLEDRNPLRPSYIKEILKSELLEIESPLREGFILLSSHQW
jgi:hypothetical protein